MNKALRPLLAATTAAAALALPLPADAAFDMFLKLDGIQGEATAKGHEKEIEVFSFSWGMARTQSIGTTRGMVGGRPCVSEMHLMKRMDKTSPLLMANVMSGMVIPKGKLSLRKAGEIPLEFVVIDLTQVLVSSVQESASSGGDDTPMESVSLHFTSAKVTYTQQGPDGKPVGSPIPATIQGADC